MKHIKKYVEMMTAEKVSRALLVVQQNLTPFAKAFLETLEPKIHLEVFQVGLLQFKWFCNLILLAHFAAIFYSLDF
jgi:hypothetical protein